MNRFHGMPVANLDNGLLRVDYLTDAGPRLVRLSPSGSDENFLAETPDIQWETPYGNNYQLIGGHRLWLAPEAQLSSFPDLDKPGIEQTGLQVCITQQPDPILGLEKSICLQLQPGQASLSLQHRITNRGNSPVELACWAITQLPLGGQAILPQTEEHLDSFGWQPNRHLVLWPYASWNDPRLTLSDKALRVAAQPRPQALKLGYFNHHGWIEYQRAGTCFRKRILPQPGLAHPDLGCNVEVYVRDRFIELETLGPLQTLQPGEYSSHQEVWEISFHTA